MFFKTEPLLGRKWLCQREVEEVSAQKCQEATGWMGLLRFFMKFRGPKARMTDHRSRWSVPLLELVSCRARCWSAGSLALYPYSPVRISASVAHAEVEMCCA